MSSSTASTTPVANFQGLGAPTETVECAPPDTDVAAGQNDVVELVNCAGNPGGSTFEVFSKSGSRVLGPVPLSNLWSHGVCADDGHGDGIIVYDQLAGRWVISQFAGVSAPTDECVAVSETGDPTGAYYVYDFQVFPNGFADYPKISVWPDAYYATFNVFSATGSSYEGEGFVAFDRKEMLTGSPLAQMIIFKGNGHDLAYSVLPADLDGYRPPPVGAPGIFVDYASPYLWGTSFYALEMWQMHVDWVNPSNSTLSGPTRITVDPFNDGLCGYARDCIPEPGGASVDGIGDRLMYRLDYRNFGDHQALVVNQTVGTGAAPSTAPSGIRWYELDAPAAATSASAWSVAQQGTYMPNDGLSRWMGSIAMDYTGDMALGFSSSSSTQNPAVSYTGRLATDPAGVMTLPETTLVTGQGYQVGTGHRWGDYSAMAVDPSDGCTFWYAQEYYDTVAAYDWSTRIGAFKFANCQRATGGVQGTVTDSATGKPIADVTVQLGNGVSTRTDSSGHYSLTTLPGGYTADATAFGYISGSAAVTIAQNQTSTQNFSLTPQPNAKLSGTVTDGSGHGYPLYSEVKVLVPGIGVVADLWTNPKTGAYSTSLPQGYTYQVDAKPFFDGYNSSSASVALTGNTTQNFALTVISACGAPGYSFVQGFGQNFNGSTFPPSGWTVTNNVAGSPVVWKLNTDWNSANFTGGTGTAAEAPRWQGYPIIFSYYDTSLVTPPVSATSLGADPVLEFRINFYASGYSNTDAVDVDINPDNTGWTTIKHFTADQGGQYSTPGVVYKFDLAPYLIGATSFQVRWRYYNLNSYGGWYVQVDDVSVGSCQPLSGGLVMGSVSDANTGQGLDGATVSDGTGGSTKTISNPADPNLPKGYYFLFAPPGTQTVTASRFNYANSSASVPVTGGGVAAKNFVLGAGMFSAAPAPLNLQLMVNTQTQKDLTVTNSGTVPAHFNVVSVDSPPPATGSGTGAPLSIIHCNGPLSPQSAAHGSEPDCSGPDGAADSANGATAWGSISDYPIPIADNAMTTDESTGFVYSFGGISNGAVTAASYVYHPASTSWSPIAALPAPLQRPVAVAINGKVYVTAGWDASGGDSQALYIYNPANDTWSSGASDSELRGGGASAVALDNRLYVIGGCYNPASCVGTPAVEIYDPANNSWSMVASYPHPIAWQGCGATEGKIYCAGGYGGDAIFNDGYAYDPGSNAWSAIAPLPVNAGGCSTWWGGAAMASASGQLLLQGGVTCGVAAITNQGFSYDVGSNTWSALPNALVADYRMGSTCGFYMVGGMPTNGVSSAEELPGYDVCTIKPIPWLTMSPATGTVGAGNAATVQLTFDGAGQTAFTSSQGYLLMPSTTPYGPKIVPLTVTWLPQPVALVTRVMANPNPVPPDSAFTLNIAVKNDVVQGDGGATQVVLAFAMPAGMSYVNGPGCTDSSGTVSCDMGDIAQGQEKDLAVVLKSGAKGAYETTFTATGLEPQDSNYAGKNALVFAGAVETLKTTGGGNGQSGGGGLGGLTLAALLGLVLLGLRRGHRDLGGDGMTRRIARCREVLTSETAWWSRRLLAVIATGIACVGLAAAAHAANPVLYPGSGVAEQPASLVTMPAQTNVQLLKRKATLVGPHSKSSVIRLTIGLKLHGTGRLKAFLQDVQYPQSPEYHHFLTPQEFTRRYGPTTEEVDAVESFLKQHGIQVLGVTRNRMLIHTEAETGVYEQAFKLGINDYTLDGRSFFSTTDRPQIPQSLSGIVQNVLGLNNSLLMRPHFHVEPLEVRGQSAPLTSAPPASTAHFNPAQIATAYDWPSITNPSNGAGVSVAIVTAESSGLASDTSASTFWSAYGLPDHTVNVIQVDGDQNSTVGMIETLLDMEYSGAMAPGITQNVYVGATAAPATFTDAYNKVVDDDTSQVMTTSWGIYESADPAQFLTDEQIFAQGAAEGISMFAAAGDHGSSDGAPSGNDNADYPSSSVYITSANGTELSVSNLSGTYGSETAWSGTGGAISQLFAQPSWQTGQGVPSSGYRMNSDMALNAGSLHPYVMYIAGRGFESVYGTSAVAPIFAALFAIGDSQQPGGASLGQSNSLIYNDVNAGNYATDFRDVTTGSNGAFSAGVGWDHPTGWGSPRATSFLSHIGIQGPEGAVKGTITNASTGKPIADATITFSPGNAVRHTGSDGTYAILLPAGSYTASVTEFGYDAQSQPISVTDGQTVTQDFPLQPKATASLSGHVTDGSGHGYGLYAEIKISAAGFGQVADIWTDPTTGAYTVKLPEGYTYSIAVQAFLDGYQNGSATVNFNGSVTQDFALKVLTACTAPGYSYSQGLGEDFNGATFPPTGWTVNTPVNNGLTVWQLNTGYGDGNYTNGTGTAAEASSSAGCGRRRRKHGCGPYDTQLISPVIQISASGPDPKLTYTANYQFYTQSSLDLGISVDGGSTWTNILSWNSAAYNCGTLNAAPGCDVSVQLGPYLGGATSFQLRWRYYDTDSSSWDWYAQVDNVLVGSCEAIPGGLVMGAVSDANTGQGLVDASVTDDKGAQANTITNPADPNLPKGFYLLFSPAGARTVTASRINYTNSSKSFTLPDNGVVQENFALDAGRISASPTALNVQVMVGSQAQKNLTITNTGSSPARFNVQPVDTPPPATGTGASAPLIGIHCATPLSPASMAVLQGATSDCSTPNGALGAAAGTAWKSISDYPVPIVNNTMTTDESTGLVYSFGGFSGTVRLAASYVYNPGTDSWSAIAPLPVPLANAVAGVINGKVYLTAGWGPSGVGSQALYIYDPSSNTWSTGASDPVEQEGAPGVAVLNDRLYVIGGCGTSPFCLGTSAVEVYDPATDSWSAAADYPHNEAWEGCGEILGRIYCAGGDAGVFTTFSDGYAYDPGSDSWSAIASLPINAYGCNDWWGGAATASASGQLLLQDGVTCHSAYVTNQGFSYDVGSNTWSTLPNALVADYRMGSACGFYMVGGDRTAGATGEELPGYDVCTIKPIPWLTMSPATGTVGAGNAATVQLTFDGTGQKKYTTSSAYLLMPSTTPYGPRIIPLTVTWMPQPVALVTRVTASPNPVAPDSAFTLNIAVKNDVVQGDGGATQVVLAFAMPAGMSYVNGPGCTESSGTVSCDMGDLAQGQEKDLAVMLKSGAKGAYETTFTATGREPQDSNYAGKNALVFAGAVGTLKTTGGGNGQSGGGSLGWLTLVALLGLAAAIRRRRI